MAAVGFSDRLARTGAFDSQLWHDKFDSLFFNPEPGYKYCRPIYSPTWSVIGNGRSALCGRSGSGTRGRSTQTTTHDMELVTTYSSTG